MPSADSAQCPRSAPPSLHTAKYPMACGLQWPNHSKGRIPMPGLLRPLPIVFAAMMAALPALALADPPFTQQTARDIIAASHKVVSPHGVQELKTIDVN